MIQIQTIVQKYNPLKFSNQIQQKKKKKTSKAYKERNLRVKLESEVENSFSFLVTFF